MPNRRRRGRRKGESENEWINDVALRNRTYNIILSVTMLILCCAGKREVAVRRDLDVTSSARRARTQKPRKRRGTRVYLLSVRFDGRACRVPHSVSYRAKPFGPFAPPAAEFSPRVFPRTRRTTAGARRTRRIQ